MDTTELPETLSAFGQHLVEIKEASADDVATGVGMALLGLAELLKIARENVKHLDDKAPDAGMTFKAKANRW